MSRRRHPRGAARALGRVVLAALLLVLAVSGVAADLSLRDWPYVKSIDVPPDGSVERLVETRLDPEVFSGAAPGLADLRVVHEGGQEAPYKLEVRTGKQERRSIPVTLRDVSYLPGRYSSFIVDLGKEGALHNEVEVATGSTNFQRDVEVEGSNDGRTWAVLQDGIKVFDFTLKERSFAARNTRVPYPQSTVRHLRVRIKDSGEGPIDIAGASVFSVEESPGHEVAYPAAIADEVEDRERRLTTLTLDLGSAGLPTSRLEVRTSQPNFYRRVDVEGSDDGQLWLSVLGSQVLYSYDTPKFVGNKLSVSYPEVFFRRLRLLVHNEDDPPLPIQGVGVFGVERRLVFMARPASTYSLYYGKPDARTPSYDLERILPYLDTERAVVGELGPQRPNPDFRERGLPVSERYPWLLPAVVAVAAAAVALLLFGVFRKARKLLPPPG